MRMMTKSSGVARLGGSKAAVKNRNGKVRKRKLSGKKNRLEELREKVEEEMRLMEEEGGENELLREKI